jgi:GntR family transcriptional regulator of vanillate catabolism
VSAAQAEEARAAIAGIDAIIASPELTEDQFQTYVELNEAFHAGIVAMADSSALAKQLARCYALPFASPSGFVRAQARLPEAHAILVFANEHHRAVLESILGREGARAEALMREHARLARRNLHLALQDRHSLSEIRGSALITPEEAA